LNIYYFENQKLKTIINNDMRSVLKILAFTGIALTLISPILAWIGTIDLEINKTLLLIGTVIWFVFAPISFLRTQKQKA